MLKMDGKYPSKRRRHRFLYRLAHILAPLTLRGFSFRTDVLKKTDENYIVMSNHLTEKDLNIMLAAFSEPMYFVAGEHLTRSKNGPFLTWAEDPVYEFKGAVALDTVREIVRRVKAGNNVIIFPEGSRSFSGETEKLPVSSAKLVKMAGCALVTYHIEGGYFVAPRWAYTERKGPMTGRVVNVYTKEQVASMSVEELTDAINRDIYENAYDTQRRNMYRYRGERLAEGLENYLVKCPVCGQYDTLRTQDDRFECVSCGLKGIYTEEGFLKGEGLPYDSVYDWGTWAEEETLSLVRASEEGSLVFHDSGMKVYEISQDHVQTDLAEGEIEGYTDRIEAAGMVFPLKDIPAMDMLYFGKTLLFTYEGRHYGITGEAFHAIKYQKIYDVLKEKHMKKKKGS